jgi:autotransporter-associated beta strand protein
MMKTNPSTHEMTRLAMAVSLVLASLSWAHAEEIQVIAQTGKTPAVTYVPFKPTLAVNTPVWLNVDDLVANTELRATQRSLGFREVVYKGVVSAALTLNAVKPTTTGDITRYDYSEQNNKGTNLVAFWKEKDLPIVIGPDAKAYITDGHHTTAGYLAAKTAKAREVVAGQGHVVLGHIAENYFSVSPMPVTDAWWQGMQAANNALLFGPAGNQLARSTDAGYAGLQPILPSALPMPTVPGRVSMTNDDYRSLTWGMVDPIVKTAATTPDGNAYLKGFSKGFPKGWVNPDSAKLNPDVANDINFVEFYWADFLRNRVVWNNTLAGCALDSTESACNGKKNLIAAPISFFAAVANGIALARSESYADQYGRKLSDYVAADYPANTRNWASASLQNGLASGKHAYHMYLLDDSSIKGDITPSALETVSNRLHIDTTIGQVVAGALKNFSAVDINRGSSIDTRWKETPAIQKYLGVNPESTLVIEPGTGAVTFAGVNTYPGPTTVAAGKLIIAPTGELSGSASLEVMPTATLQNDGKVSVGSYTQQPAATLRLMPNAAGQVHPMSIAGTARLGGTLVLAKGSKNWKPGVTYTLLKAADIQGKFSVVTSETKFKPALKYGKNTVTVSFKN